MSFSTDGASHSRAAVSAARGRLVCAALALILPLVLYGLFRRQELRLLALADHGEEAAAVVVDRTSEAVFYRYQVGSRTYDFNVNPKDVPHAVGARFSVTYLPEDPELSRPYWRYDRAHLEAERSRGITIGMPLGLFAFFSFFALVYHRAARKALDGGPVTGPKRAVSPVLSGRILAAILITCLLGTILDSDVRGVFARLFGDTLLGLPTPVAVVLAQGVLLAPAFWVMPELMRILQTSVARGGSLSKLGIVLAVMGADTELRRSRNIVIAGALYFVLLMAAWIAFATLRGV